MQKLLTFLKNRVVISIIGLIVVSLLIWFMGPEIKFGTDNISPLGGEIARLITIMIIIVVWGLNNLRIALQDKKNNDGLVADLQHNQANSRNLVTEQSSEEIHVINERFTQALTTLKKLKFKGGGGRKALYELPWYIIIGPPGSGKTTALVHSSLEFPLAEKYGKEALHGVGGTRNCDWWFTNDAVLIDTAGRYTTQDSHKVIDSSSWDGFLGMLKKYRRRRPINGAIVAISLQELLMQTEEERITHARTIRARIDELMAKLEIRFPIYLMLTKSDLVSGFSEYFEELNKEDREQVWGVSLPNSPAVSQSPDFDFLEEEYDNLIKRLYAGLISRIHHERDVNRRGVIQGFPQQMENIKEIITQFVRQAFVKNRYQYQPYLRGLYFTSGTQDGTPIDRLMSSVSTNFGFDRQAVSPGFAMGKSFFLGRLFRDVIFPESELVGSNRKYELFIRWTQRAAYIGLAVITASLISIWAGSFTRNEMYMHDVEAYIADFKANRKHINAWARDPAVILPALDSLAKASAVYNKDAHPWLSGLGMYDNSVDESADKAYNSKLIHLYLPYLLKYMEFNLNAGQTSVDLYDNFRTYMMFNKIQHLDKARVMEWFSGHWNNEYPGNAQVVHGLMSHLSALLSLKLDPSELNMQLVESIRSRLMQIPVPQRIYNRIRTNPEYSSRINLINEFGDSVRAEFTINENVQQKLKIPVLFTLQAYKSLDLSPNSKLIASLARENWVLSDGKDEHKYMTEMDLDKVSDKVKEFYYAEYNSHWGDVYRSLSIKPFQDLRQANDALLNFVDPVYSPLISIMNVGSANTTLTNPMASDLEGEKKDDAKGKALSLLSSRIQLTAVDKQFGELNQLMREAKNRPPQIQNVIQKIRQLQEFVNGIIIAPEPGKKAYEIAKARYQGGGGNAITSLATYAQTAPQPIGRWLNAISNETWKVILRSAHGYVNNQWHDQVYNSCMTALSKRYPLYKDSSDDVSMADFTEFFKPGGTMDKFTTEFVKPFVDAGSGWNNKGVDNYSIGFASETLSQIRKAAMIKSIYFKANPGMPALSFELRPYQMNKTDERFILEMGDKRITYSHGPKFWSTFNWTGTDENGRVRVIFEDLAGKQHSITYEGPWAWFRLQGKADLERTSSRSTYLVTYNVADGSASELAPATHDSRIHSISYEIRPKSVMNPFGHDLLDTFRCSGRI